MNRIETNINTYHSLESLMLISNKSRIIDICFSKQVISSENIQLWDSLNEFDNLECIIFRECYIKRLPSFKNIKRLKILIIENCWELCNLPDLTELRGLEELRIYIKNPRTNTELLPKPNFSKLELQRLCLLRMTNNTELINLDTDELTIMNSIELTELPDLSKTKNIKRLLILNTHIKSLKGIENLKQLETLELTDFHSLNKIDYIDKCVNLKRIKLIRCDLVESICDLSNLSKLVSLEIIECNRLKRLPEVFLLRYLKISGIKDNKVFYNQLPNNLVYLELDEIREPLTNLPSSLELIIIKRNSEHINKSKLPFNCIIHIGKYEGLLNIELDDSFY
jgi:hypothetical protein